MKNKSMKKIIGILFLVLVLLLHFEMEEDKPSAYEQERIFILESQQLDFADLVEQRREFLRQQTYIVSYECPNVLEREMNIRERLLKEFGSQDWKYKNKIVLNNGVVQLHFVKKDYSCYIHLYKNNMDLRFRYEK